MMFALVFFACVAGYLVAACAFLGLMDRFEVLDPTDDEAAVAALFWPVSLVVLACCVVFVLASGRRWR